MYCLQDEYAFCKNKWDGSHTSTCCLFRLLRATSSHISVVQRHRRKGGRTCFQQVDSSSCPTLRCFFELSRGEVVQKVVTLPFTQQKSRKIGQDVHWWTALCIRVGQRCYADVNNRKKLNIRPGLSTFTMFFAMVHRCSVIGCSTRVTRERRDGLE